MRTPSKSVLRSRVLKALEWCRVNNASGWRGTLGVEHVSHPDITPVVTYSVSQLKAYLHQLDKRS